MNWPDLKFPPINLWSAPTQDIEYMRKEVSDIEKIIAHEKLRHAQHQRFIKMNESVKEIAKKRLKDLEFIYYTRTGKFPK